MSPLDRAAARDDRLRATQRLLREHEPADAREAAFQARMLALSRASGDPFARDHLEPGHFTASAFILSPDRQRLLLILHSKLHLWLQPGGHVDPTDVDLLRGARREAEEETGLALVGGALLDLDIHPIPANPRKGEPEHEHLDVRFVFESPTWDVAAASDALEAKWVPLDEVHDAGTDESVLRAVRKLQILDIGQGLR